MRVDDGAQGDEAQQTVEMPTVSRCERARRHGERRFVLRVQNALRFYAILRRLRSLSRLVSSGLRRHIAKVSCERRGGSRRLHSLVCLLAETSRRQKPATCVHRVDHSRRRGNKSNSFWLLTFHMTTINARDHFCTAP